MTGDELYLSYESPGVLMSSEGVRQSYTSVNLRLCQLLTRAGIKFDFRATLNPGSRGCSVSPTRGLTRIIMRPLQVADNFPDDQELKL